jgi:hypothetical protein
VSEGDGGDAAIREGMAAWGRGDLDALERLLDPSVTLRAIEPGPWDCDDREQVMSLLRLREEQGRAEARGDVEVKRLDESTFLVAGLAGGVRGRDADQAHGGQGGFDAADLD